MEVERGPENENRSPQAKNARLEEKLTTMLGQRKPLAPLAANSQPINIPSAKGAFTVFCDAAESVPAPKGRLAEGGLKERQSSTSSWEASQTQSSHADSEPSTSADATSALLSSVSAYLRHGVWAPTADDSGLPIASPMAQDMSCSSADLTDTLAVDARPTDADSVDSSAYASVLSEGATSYYTAPLASAKDLHREQITTCPAYADEIFAYLQERETLSSLRISRSYIGKQTELTEAMRRTLVDWMFEVAVEYNLDQQTFHLAVRYVDRFLSLMDIPRHKLQLIGTTATMIAAKLEEIYPPELKEYVFITDDTYTEAQVRRMERLMLEHLDFQLYTPTVVLFATRLLAVCKAGGRTAALAKYLVDVSLMSLDLAALRPSQVAAAAVCLANLMTDGGRGWPVELETLTGFSATQLLPLIQSFLRHLHWVEGQAKETAIRDKYAEHKHHGASKIQLPSVDSVALMC